ncbi:MAG: hypothetical protein ACRDUX_35060 [Mycobacterium sp.]
MSEMGHGTWVMFVTAGVIAIAMPAGAARFSVRANMEAPPGTILEVPVRLFGEGALVSTAHNELSVAPPLVIRAKPDGTPDCVDFPEQPVAVSFVTFSFVPPACVGAACTGVRASIDVVPPQDVQTIVYYCTVEIPWHAPPGFYPLLITSAGATDAAGNALPTTTQEDAISVPELPKSGMLFVDTVEGRPGESVWFDVTLEATVGAQVIGVITGVEYDKATQIVADDLGAPRCLVKGAFATESDFFFSCFEPGRCVGVYVDFRVDEDPDTAFPSGSVMFSCLVAISPAALPGTYPLFCQNVRIITYDTGSIQSHCNSGAVRVLAPDAPTLTPTVTPQPPSPTPSAAPTRTQTPVEPTSTRTPAPAETSTVPPSLTPRPSDSSGCAIVVRPASNSPWLLWSPAAALLWAGLRRAVVHRAR